MASGNSNEIIAMAIGIVVGLVICVGNSNSNGTRDSHSNSNGTTLNPKPN